MIGLRSDEINSIFKVIAVVLKMGNLIFIPTTNIDGTEGCEVCNEYGKLNVAFNFVRFKMFTNEL